MMTDEVLCEVCGNASHLVFCYRPKPESPYLKDEWRVCSRECATVVLEQQMLIAPLLGKTEQP